jgi:hypothetical protein
MEVTINLSDIASLLAHEIVCAKFEDDDDYMYEVITDTEISYIKEAQELFDEWYDYYYKLINNLKIK